MISKYSRGPILVQKFASLDAPLKAPLNILEIGLFRSFQTFGDKLQQPKFESYHPRQSQNWEENEETFGDGSSSEVAQPPPPPAPAPSPPTPSPPPPPPLMPPAMKATLQRRSVVSVEAGGIGGTISKTDDASDKQCCLRDEVISILNVPTIVLGRAATWRRGL